MVDCLPKFVIVEKLIHLHVNKAKQLDSSTAVMTFDLMFYHHVGFKELLKHTLELIRILLRL